MLKSLPTKPRELFPELQNIYTQAVQDLMRTADQQEHEKLVRFCKAFKKEIEPLIALERLNSSARDAGDPVRFICPNKEPLRLIT